MFCILSDIKKNGPDDKRARKVAGENTGFSHGAVRSVHNNFKKYGDVVGTHGAHACGEEKKCVGGVWGAARQLRQGGQDSPPRGGRQGGRNFE